MTDKELAEAYQNVNIKCLELDLEGEHAGIPSMAVSQEACNLMSKCLRRFLEIYGDPDKQKKLDNLRTKVQRMNR